MTTESDVLREIRELHEFFEGWIGGSLPGGDEVLRRFTDAMDGSFTLVTPGGAELTVDDLVRNLRSGRGVRPGFRIGVEDVRVIHDEPPLVVARYREVQESGGETTRRLSTAVFHRSDGAPNGLVWLSVHETWTGDGPREGGKAGGG